MLIEPRVSGIATTGFRVAERETADQRSAVVMAHMVRTRIAIHDLLAGIRDPTTIRPELSAAVAP